MNFSVVMSMTVEPEIMGSHQQPDWSILDGKLYGRKQEERRLKDGFTRIALTPNKGAAPELTLITGVSGSGKTALVVGSLRPHVLAMGGFFMSGKYDRLEGPDKHLAVV